MMYVVIVSKLRSSTLSRLLGVSGSLSPLTLSEGVRVEEVPEKVKRVDEVFPVELLPAA